MRGEFKIKDIKLVILFPLVIIIFFIGYYTLIEVNLFFNTIKLNDEFYFAPFEGQEDYVLSKDPLIYGNNISLAYWNSDSLVFKSDDSCFLIVFENTKSNDDIIPIECGNIRDYISTNIIDSLVRY